MVTELKRLKNVEEAYRIRSEYDWVVKVRADTEDVKEMSTWKIRKLKRGRSTPSVVARDQV